MIQHLATQLRRHLFIRHRRHFAQATQRRETARGKTFRFDFAEIPAASFDVENFRRIAEEIRNHRLYGCIAAAVEHEFRGFSEQTRCVYSHRQIFTPARTVFFDKLSGVDRAVFGMHAATLSRNEKDRGSQARFLLRTAVRPASW